MRLCLITHRAHISDNTTPPRNKWVTPAAVHVRKTPPMRRTPPAGSLFIATHSFPVCCRAEMEVEYDDGKNAAEALEVCRILRDSSVGFAHVDRSSSSTAATDCRLTFQGILY